MASCNSNAIYINIRENRKGQSRMDNPETLETFGTQDTGRKPTKQKTQHRKSENEHIFSFS